MNNKNADNKIALITGGNRGLGKNALMHLAAQGIDVIFTFRSHPEEAEQVLKMLASTNAKAVALPLDVADCGSFALFAEKVTELLNEHWACEQFDFLVNNAGTGL